MNDNEFGKLKELVLRYNESIIGCDPENPAFTSRFRFEHSDLSARISKINWFSNCGKPSAVQTTMPIRFVDTLDAATKICSRFDWENFKIDARNQLTIWLNEHHKDDYQKWNDFALSNNKIIDAFVGETIKLKLEQLELECDITKYVRSDLQDVFIANDFLFTDHRCYFAFELLNVYTCGHIPCGWVGEWPAGYLVAH